METTAESLVTFTPSALKELERTFSEKLESAGPLTAGAELGLRLGVVGGGCAGMSYVLDFDQPTDKDLVFYAGDSLRVYINKAHNLYLSGMQVDYQDGLNARGFTFSNPNATATCGCGSSFGI